MSTQKNKTKQSTLIFANTGGQCAVPKPVDQKNYCLVRLIKTKDLKVVAKSRVLGDETDLLVNCDYDVLIYLLICLVNYTNN